MLHYLAIDTGGSKTDFMVFDDTKTVVFSFKTEGFGLAIDSEEDIPVLRESLRKIKSEYKISAIAVNLGGKNKNQLSRIIADCIPDAKLGIYRESEGYASVAFGKKTGADVILLAGTGTIVTGISPSGEQVICGGWGMNIGDLGSGYYIGLEAVKNALDSLDGTAPLSPMQSEITGRTLGIEKSKNAQYICDERDMVRSRIFPIERQRIASYAKIVAKHCESGDENAPTIMNNAGIEMAKLVYKCIMKLAPHKVKKIAVSGGLCNSKTYWQQSFESWLTKEYGILSFIYESDGIMQGTMELALNGGEI